MVLTDEEKALAHTTATNNLINMLRAMPGPPVHLLTDAQVKRHAGLLHGARRRLWDAAWRPQQIENAYSLRGRPNVDMLQQLALFWGSSAVPVVATT